jgi:protein-tyrosine-phosphatase
MSNLTQITLAQTLDEIGQTMDPSPLESEQEIKAFYREEMNKVRGGRRIERMQLGLQKARRNSTFFKALFLGHSGSGKSTELNCLSINLKNDFTPVRIRVDSLSPANFQALDVLLLMMIEVAEQTSLPIAEGGAGRRPSDQRLRDIWNWFHKEKITVDRTSAASLDIEGAMKLGGESLWQKILEIFASVKGGIKFSSTRKKEITEYRIDRVDELITMANNLLDDCNQAMREATQKEWLFIGEDFDKGGLSSTRLEDLFLSYSSNVFQNLRAHMIFNLPIYIYYSKQGSQLIFPQDRTYILPDTSIFRPDQNKTPNLEGRQALEAVLSARANPQLFAAGQMMRLIVASGGNLRDLFSMVRYAADTAILDGATEIGPAQVKEAILDMRSNYERFLGQSPFSAEKVTYQQKADKLLEIYRGNYDATIHDEVIHSLLSARAVQEFNSDRWFGVHPLVVDILVKQGKIQRPPGGGLVLGGIE